MTPATGQSVTTSRNSIYMAMFDSFIRAVPARHEPYRQGLLTGYAAASRTWLHEGVIDRYIAMRVAALDRWLGDLSNAPIGIQTASAEWLDTLRSFVVAQR